MQLPKCKSFTFVSFTRSSSADNVQVRMESHTDPPSPISKQGRKKKEKKKDKQKPLEMFPRYKDNYYTRKSPPPPPPPPPSPISPCALFLSCNTHHTKAKFTLCSSYALSLPLLVCSKTPKTRDICGKISQNMYKQVIVCMEKLLKLQWQERDRETERQTDRKTGRQRQKNRQRQRKTDRQRDGQRDRQTDRDRQGGGGGGSGLSK